MKSQIKILQILSFFIIFGGIVRVFANKTLFAVFQMEALWTDHLYFIYIYKVLGAFVILTGLLIYAILKNPGLYKNLMPTLSAGFVIIGLVMSVSGILLGLPFIFYFLDFIFCFLLAWLFFDLKRKLFNNSGEKTV